MFSAFNASHMRNSQVEQWAATQLRPIGDRFISQAPRLEQTTHLKKQQQTFRTTKTQEVPKSQPEECERRAVCTEEERMKMCFIWVFMQGTTWQQNIYRPVSKSTAASGVWTSRRDGSGTDGDFTQNYKRVWTWNRTVSSTNINSISSFQATISPFTFPKLNILNHEIFGQEKLLLKTTTLQFQARHTIMILKKIKYSPQNDKNSCSGHKST